MVEGGNQHQQSEIKKRDCLEIMQQKKRETRAHELLGGNKKRMRKKKGRGEVLDLVGGVRAAAR